MDPDTIRPAHWYRPGHLEESEGAAGTYQVRDDGAIEAWLHGSWYDLPSIALMGGAPAEPFPEIVYGDVFGESVTLVNTHRGTSRGNLSRLQVTEIVGGYAVEGLWLEPEELAVTTAHVQLVSQDEWAEWFAFPAEMPGDEHGITGISVRYEKPEARQCAIPGGTLRLADASTSFQRRSPSGWDLRSRSVFEFTFDEPVPVRTLFRDYVAPLEFLLTSATGQRSGVLSLRATNETWVLEGERHPSQRWVTIRVRHPEIEEPIPSSALLHRLSDFDFAAQVPRIFEVATRLRYPLEHYSLLRSGTAGPLAAFMTAAQLAESTQRALDPSRARKSMAKRLAELDPSSGGIITSIIGTDEWCAQVAELRNVVAHGYGGSHVLTEDHRSVQAGRAILELLFETRLLVELGFTPEHARELAERRGRHGHTVHTIREGYPYVEAVAQWKPDVSESDEDADE